MEREILTLMKNPANVRESITGTRVQFGISNTEMEHIRTPGSSDDQFVITWLMTGRGSFEESGRVYKLSDMCVYLRRPGHDYRLCVDAARSVRLFFDLPDEMYPTLAILIPELDHIPPVREIKYRRELFDEFMSLTAEMNKTPITSFHNLLPRLVHFILDLTGILADRNTLPLLHARTLLEDVTSKLSLGEIASICGINYNTFRKQFNAAFGSSPGQYRISCRIEAAKNALAAGESVAVISERFGFADVYTFTHRFTEVVGKPPARYRDENFG